MRYRAFISYSHADAATAAWLHRKLEGWRVPKRMRVDNPALPDKLAPVFRDREELGSAGELGPQIQAALSDSEALIVLCSPEAARSRWVDSEVRAFRASGRGDRVFALIVSGEPHSGDERECFPPALRESEPLAADLRAGKDGKELALLKLIAGLLHVPLDTLRQREARRRHQRMLAVTSLAVLVMLVTSVLAIQASIARQAAERRQKQAEALVGFMIGDLNDKLTEVSRLDILEGVHDHAMAYFESLPDTDVTDQALEQRARALVQIGNVRRDQGHLPKAMQSYRAAEKITARLAQAAPTNVPRQLAQADVLTYLGLVHWYQGELDQAQSSFDAARSLLVRTRKLDPGNQKLLFQLSTVDNNAGHVLEGRGRVEAATEHYRQMLEAAQKLASLAPDNTDWQSQVGLAHNNLAKMSLLQGDLEGAVAGYRADVAIEEALAKHDPRNNAQAEHVVWSSGALGRTLALTGALDEGASALQKALEEAERLRGVEPGASTYSEDIGIYASQLARLRRLQGNTDAARALIGRSMAAFDALAKLDATNLSWQRDRADALVERAQLFLMANDTGAARTDLQQALALLEPQLAQQPDERGMLLTSTAARMHLASLSPPEEAGKQLRAALAACDAQASAPRDPRLRALRAELLWRLGEQARARELAVELWQSGYRDAAFATLARNDGR